MRQMYKHNLKSVIKEQYSRYRLRPHHAPLRALLLGTYTSFREASMRRKMKRRMVKPQSDEPP